MRDGVVHETNIGTLSSYMRNATNGWSYTLDHLGLFFEHALAIPQDDGRIAELDKLDLLSPRLRCRSSSPSCWATTWTTCACWPTVRPNCTLALASRPDMPTFAPEPFTTFYRQSVYHGMLGQLNRAFELLRSRAARIAAEGAAGSCGGAQARGRDPHRSC